MSITTAAAATFEATVENAGTGLVGTLTVRIEDGQDQVVTAATTSGIVESGIGIYTATLVAPDDAGQYLVIWNDGDGHEASEDLTVTGSVRPAYITVDEMRARYTDPLEDEEEYPDERVAEVIGLAIEAFEHAADVAFAPRTETLTINTFEPSALQIPRAKVISVDAITGSTTGVIDPAGQVLGGSTFVSTSSWSTAETLTVTLTHGYPSVPLRVKQAIMILTRVWLTIGPVDARATQIPAADGGVINLATPGVFGSVFGIPEVDAALGDYRHHALVA